MGVSLRGGKDVVQVKAKVTSEDLRLLAEFIETGKLRPRIDRSSPFAEVPGAIAYVEAGHARGKVIVTGAASEVSSEIVGSAW